ncbi:hypothetical protein BV20DRAFT_1051639 [Pilatotrama ljubarskyi]|nr:hypothetical protein BV20DRAFT_1051639 [Pilatotrama ljubarskyi]
MSVFTKDLRFWSHNLGDNVTLMLCFTPPTPDLFVKQFPVAWKVTTLSATGGSVLDATYTNQLGFCMPQIGGNSKIVSASNYTPIGVGETTTLDLNTSINPPVYSFTPPVPLPGTKGIQAVNNTGHPVTIALGFINEMGTDNETMNPVLTWRNVGQGLAVTGEFTPVLRAYLTLNYQESEILKGEVKTLKPIWQENLASLGPKTSIHIIKDASGAFSAKTAVAMDVPVIPKIPTDGKARVYKAELAFSSPRIVMKTARAIGEYLWGKSYIMKFIYKEGATEARVELTLPQGISCQQAERDVVSAIDSDPLALKHVQIKGHGGEMMVSSQGSFLFWHDINPASVAWYKAGKGNAITRSAIANGAKSATYEDDGAESDGEADGTEFDAGDAANSSYLLTPELTNGQRSLSRKSSRATLAN